MSVATHAAHAAHPYASASAQMRRASTSARRQSLSAPPPHGLPPLPPHAAYAAAAAAPSYAAPPALPAYTRHDRPGGETRLAKVDRTAQWVAQHGASEPAPPTSLQGEPARAPLAAAPRAPG